MCGSSRPHRSHQQLQLASIEAVKIQPGSSRRSFSSSLVLTRLRLSLRRMPTGEDGEGWPDAVVKEGEQDKMVVEDGCAEAAVEAQGLVDRPMPLQVSDTPGKENEVEGRKE